MLEKIWKKVVRREPYSIWDIPAFLLWLVSFPYRWVVKWRRAMSRPSTRLDIPVISIGNVTVGGSGKTPLVSLIAHDLLDKRVRVGIVSSGYRRIGTDTIVKRGIEISQMDVGDTGDEVMLLAQLLPNAVFSVDNSKSEAARRLSESGEVDVIIVDDGFQHFQLHRDIDLVTYDAGVKRRRLKMFPYGLLREPVKALAHAHILVITRAKHAIDLNSLKKRLKKINSKADIYHASFSGVNLIGHERTLPIKYLEDKSVFLFAGVGNFRALKRQVIALSGDLDYACELSDHQVYTPQVLSRIKKLADKQDSDLMLTTFKDWVKLGDFDFGREVYYLDIVVDLDPGEEKLMADIIERLQLKAEAS